MRRSGLHQSGNHFLAHERLAIIDPTSGDQPLFNEDKTISVTVNGEIYNYKDLMAKILEQKPGRKFATQSDCEVGCRNPTGTGGTHVAMRGCQRQRPGTQHAVPPSARRWPGTGIGNLHLQPSFWQGRTLEQQGAVVASRGEWGSRWQWSW